MTHPLQEAFVASRYRVCLDGVWLETRIGQCSPPIAAWLGARGQPCASLVSARNPEGQALDEQANAVREARLRQRLLAEGLVLMEAEGLAAEEGGWREPGLWAAGLGGGRCRVLMRDFDQLAWVEYDADGLAQLRWTAEPIPGE